MAKPPMTPAKIFEELVNRVVLGPGTVPMKQRAAAAGAGVENLPVEAVPVIEKIRKHAYKVTDEDIASLKQAGLDDEAIFELTVVTAVGVAERRLEAAMKVIHAAG